MADGPAEPERPAEPPRLHIRALPEPAENGAAVPAIPTLREGLLGVRPDELGRTAILATYLFVASCVFVLGRTVRDALFLSHYQQRVGSMLPFMFIAYGAASAVVALVYMRYAPRARRDRFVATFSLVGAITYLGARALVARETPWLYAALYVWAEIVGNLTLAQFWSVANDLHDPRSAKRLFGIIGIGRIVGLVVCGLGAGNFVSVVGTDNLLYVLAALLVVIALLVSWMGRRFGLARPDLAPQLKKYPSLLAPMRSSYVRVLALMMLVGFVAVNVGDFQFKAAARLAHPGRDALAHFMSMFYATLGVIALLLQLVGTRWVLRRFGVLGGVLALPVAYLAANFAFLAVPSIQTVTLLKISDNAFQFTIFEATLQLLYFPLPDDAKDGVRSFLEALAKPLGYAMAGVLVLAFRFIARPDTMHGIAIQSWFVLPLMGAWLAIIPVVRRRYLDSLERSIRRARVDAGIGLVNDAATRDVLLRTIAGPAARPAVYALEQLTALDEGATRGALPSALASKHAEVRIAALRTIETLRAWDLRESVTTLIDDPNDAVAAKAVDTFGELAGEDCLDALASRVHSTRPRLQDATMSTLLRRGGLEGTLAAGRVVEAWLGSSDPSDRARAAALFARPGIHGLQRIVRRLLTDAEPSVRRAALAAAGSVGDPATVPVVLEAMNDAPAASSAARALIQIGDAAINAIDVALGDEKTPRVVKLALPRVLAGIRTQRAYRVLLRHIDAPDEWVRQKVLASASRCRAAGQYESIDPNDAEPRMLREIEGVARMRAQYVASRAFLALPLLDRWVIERLRKGLIRVLRLGELAHPYGQVSAARDALFATDTARRARAVELLENLLDVRVRRQFVVELDAFIELKQSPLPRPSPPNAGTQAFVEQLLDLPESFARVIALDASQFRGLRLPDDKVRALTGDEDPAVREMAALVLATFQPDGWRDVLGRLRDDPDVRVRTYAEYSFSTGRTGMDPWDEMYTTLEKVLFLQRIPLFAEVPPEHLLALARSADVEPRAAGAVVFRHGDPGDALYFVIDGRVRVVRDGRPAVDLGESEVFGEMSVLDSSPRSDSVEVVEDSTLLRIAQEDFYDVLHDTAELAEGVIHVLVRRLRAATAAGA